jgi:hypothetical protein
VSWPAYAGELRADRLVDGERSERHMVADAANDDPARHVRPTFRAAAGAVTAIDAILLSTFENGMLGDDIAVIEDADQIGELLDLDNPAGAIGHTVIVAADGDKAIVADAPFQLEHGIEAMLGQRLQLGLLGRERLGDDALGGAVNADIGDGMSQSMSWTLRSSRSRKLRPRKKSWRI